jgi:hypothetical protein
MLELPAITPKTSDYVGILGKGKRVKGFRLLRQAELGGTALFTEEQLVDVVFL